MEGSPSRDLEGTGVKDVNRPPLEIRRKLGWARLRLGMGMEASSWTPLTTCFLHSQRVQSVPGQACPGACGGWGAGAGRWLRLSPTLIARAVPPHLNHDHDIMLLELKSSVQLQAHPDPAPLPPALPAPAPAARCLAGAPPPAPGYAPSWVASGHTGLPGRLGQIREGRSRQESS